MSTADRLARSGEQFLTEGRLDQAAESFRSALLEDARHPGAQLGLARLSMGLGLSQEAGELLDRLRKKSPRNAEGLVLRALVAEGSGDLELALDLFADAVAAAPSAAFTRYQHGRALCVARRFEQAVPELQAAASLEPKAVSVHYALGVAHRELERLGDSIAAFTKALEIDPRFADCYLTLADVLCEAQREPLAEKLLKQGRALLPESGALCDKLAAVSLKLGDSRGAVEALRALTVTNPTEDAFVSLATVALGAGDAKSAASAIDRLLSDFPKSWRGHHLKSMLLDTADQLEPAIAELREAHRLAPQEWRPLNDLGTLLNARSLAEQAGQDEAGEVLEQAADLAPAHELAPRYNLGLAYWNAGRPRDARRVIQRMLDDAPEGHPVTAQAQQFLEAVRRAER